MDVTPVLGVQEEEPPSPDYQPELSFDHNKPTLVFMTSIFHIVGVQTIFGILNLLHVKAKKS